jgi:hypothetical protein
MLGLMGVVLPSDVRKAPRALLPGPLPSRLTLSIPRCNQRSHGIMEGWS